MKILGLDLGIGSVGWALIETDDSRNPIRIIDMGCRIIPVSPDETKNFEKGSAETINGKRTFMRSARKRNYRYKMRRSLLKATLSALGMIDQKSEVALRSLSPMQLWQLRADAATPGKQITLAELGRVLMHLNQKRGYRHAKTDGNDSKQTQYVQGVNRNYADIKDLGMTIGQYQYSKLKESETHTAKGCSFVMHQIRDTVYPRQAYMEEFDTIMQVQARYYPAILTDEVIARLRDIIFFQRPLKSCKHLVSMCEFESHVVHKKADGSAVTVGPKVAPRTSPIAQATRLYEAINNITIVNSANRGNKDVKLYDEADFFNGVVPVALRKKDYVYRLNAEERQRIFDYLNTNEKLTATTLLKLLGLKKSDGFVPDKAIGRGIKGNDTYVRIASALGDYPGKEELLKFDLDIVDSGVVNADSGEILSIVSADVIKQPLYRLWHLLYSVSDKDELAGALGKQFGITDPEVVDRLCAIDFVTPGFSNRSAKFMRKLLPRLMDGITYADAAGAIGVNHSGSITSADNAQRPLDVRLKLLEKNSLRQPLVEKILNQMINVVNALVERYGAIDEARVELARQLKQSSEERVRATQSISKNEKENADIEAKIREFGIRPSRSRIQKYKMWEESGKVCMYCGIEVKDKEFLESHDAEVEHIIPRSLYFDDSFANKTCACHKCNHDKGNRTAYDYMSSLGGDKFAAYEQRVDNLYADGKISRRKHSYLLMKQSEIPTDFIERDLRQSQYIARKALEILRGTIRNVWASSGAVTGFFRHAWGYDNILHDLNVDKYQLAGLVENEEYEHRGQKHVRARIKGWTKRLDHRHHAIDALTIALTTQGYVQRLNNLSSQHGNLFDDLTQENVELRDNSSLLTKWAATRPHFTVEDVASRVSEIAISLKRGVRLATPAKRYIRRGGKRVLSQTGIVVPRGSLHEESIYGRIRVYDGAKAYKDAFQNPHLVVNNEVREEIERRIADAGNDVAKALKALKKSPFTVVINGEQHTLDTIPCYREEIVLRYKVDGLKATDVKYIVDKAVREAVAERYDECGGNQKLFQNSVNADPICLKGSPMPIKSVRCMTGLNAGSLAGVRKDGSGKIIGLAKTGDNHHVAFYRDENGKECSMITSRWGAIRRKLNGIPAVVTDPAAAWVRLEYIADEAVAAEIAASLPMPGWQFIQSMRRNDMFVLGMGDEAFADAVAAGDQSTLARHLYRVQTISNSDYRFRGHTETTVDESNEAKVMKSVLRIQSSGALAALTPRKVKVSLTGEIIPL